MSYQVVLLSPASRDVQQIYDWIAERSLDGAGKWFNRFNEALLALELNPERYPLAPEDEGAVFGNCCSRPEKDAGIARYL